MKSSDPEAAAGPHSSSPGLARLIDRRRILAGGLGLMAGSFFTRLAAGAQDSPPRRSWFTPIASSIEDRIRVPAGYTARPFACWGEPIGHPDGAPAFKSDASNTARDQALQFGMNADGMTFFPLPAGSSCPTRGLLCINHEYVDRGLLHPAKPGFSFTPTQIEKEMNAHGVSVVEIVLVAGEWRIQRPSPFARRVTGQSRIAVGGPARGHALLKTAFDASGEWIRGTLNNCANGFTPWGTYLTCEENFNGYFTDRGPIDARRRRYGIGRGSNGWAKAAAEGGANFERFDSYHHPHEPNRFGWVVEIDPYEPESVPVKRSALGRFKHENAALVRAKDGRIVVYMGDDERFEYLYKFVSRNRFDPEHRDKNRNLLDEGTLHAARFLPDGRGEWLPLTMEVPVLKEHFSDLGELLIHARIAADLAGATPMDRPEWIAADPHSSWVYCTLTNNSRREEPDPANPRAKNEHGQVVRWKEDDPSAPRFNWELFLLAGDPQSAVETNQGTLKGDLFSSPDGLSFDSRGVLWIQTDVSSGKLYHPSLAPERLEYEGFGNNQLLAVDPAEGRVRRFLTGPVGCEITGFTMTPDGRTLFVNVQHPGEPLDEAASSNDAAMPSRYSSWPYGGRPRSGTVVITKDDGGLIGT